MNFAYGNDYGGVQAAEQAADQGDRNYGLAIIAAQQAAQRLAQEQQAQNDAWARANEEAAQRRASMLISQQQFAENRAADMSRQDMNRALAERGLDLEQQRINATAKEIASKHDDFVKSVDAQGPILAAEYADFLNRKSDADKKLLESQDRNLTAKQTADYYINQHKVSKGPDNIYRPVDMTDKGMTTLTDYLNKEISTAATMGVQAGDLRRQLATQLVDFNGRLKAGGFLIDPRSGSLVHGVTKQTYSFQPEDLAKTPTVTGKTVTGPQGRTAGVAKATTQTASSQQPPPMVNYDPQTRTFYFPGQPTPAGTGTARRAAAGGGTVSQGDGTAPPPPMGTGTQPAPAKLMVETGAEPPPIPPPPPPADPVKEATIVFQTAIKNAPLPVKKEMQLRFGEMVAQYLGIEGKQIGSSVFVDNPGTKIANGLFATKQDPVVLKMLDSVPKDVMAKILIAAAQRGNFAAPAPVPARTGPGQFVPPFSAPGNPVVAAPRSPVIQSDNPYGPMEYNPPVIKSPGPYGPLMPGSVITNAGPYGPLMPSWEDQIQSRITPY